MGVGFGRSRIFFPGSAAQDPKSFANPQNKASRLARTDSGSAANISPPSGVAFAPVTSTSVVLFDAFASTSKGTGPLMRIPGYGKLLSVMAPSIDMFHCCGSGRRHQTATLSDASTYEAYAAVGTISSMRISRATASSSCDRKNPCTPMRTSSCRNSSCESATADPGPGSSTIWPVCSDMR